MPEVVNLFRIPFEGQTVDVDDALVRTAADIAIGRQRYTQIEVPAIARADLGKKEVHVFLDRLGHIAGQDRLEMLPRQTVLAFQKEGASQFQAHTYQRRITNQHCVKGANRLVQQGVPLLVGAAAALRRADRREAIKEQRVGLDRPLKDLGPQQDQRLLEATSIEQFRCPKSLDRISGVLRRRPGALDGDEKAGGKRQDAAGGGEKREHCAS